MQHRLEGNIEKPVIRYHHIEAPNRDVDAYAKNIDTLLSDNALHDRLAQAGKERAESMFTIPKMIEECDISYNKIIYNI